METEASTTAIDEETFSFTWNIDNWETVVSDLTEGKPLESIEFQGGSSTGHSWCLRLTKFINPTKRDLQHLGVFLRLTEIGQNDEDENVSARYLLQILDQDDNPILYPALFNDFWNGKPKKADFVSCENEMMTHGDRLFVRTSSLKREREITRQSRYFAQYLNIDTNEKFLFIGEQLRIVCRIWLPKGHKKASFLDRTSLTNKTFTSKTFKNFLDSALNHDVVITTDKEDQEFKTHKIILSASSSVFAGILETKSSSGGEIPKILIEGFTNNVIQEMLFFLYTGEVEKKKNAEELIRIGKEYEIKDLINYCFMQIPPNIAPEYAAKIRLALIKNNVPAEFQPEMMQYISANFNELTYSPAFQNILKGQPKSIRQPLKHGSSQPKWSLIRDFIGMFFQEPDPKHFHSYFIRILLVVVFVFIIAYIFSFSFRSQSGRTLMNNNGVCTPKKCFCFKFQ